MRSPQKEARDPNRASGPAVGKRSAGGTLGGSPAKKQMKKVPSKKDRRRVSFAPDPELTMVHHFLKDEDYTSNSDGQGRVVVQCDVEEVAPAQRVQPDAQHPALVGDASGSGGAGAYRPGFWNKTVPENSPLSDYAPMESPGMVSMEITQPTVGLQGVAAADAAGGLAEVTAGLPSLGALVEADELEAASEQPRQQQQFMQALAPGEVTAGLPSLGALADEWETEEAGGWAGAGDAANITANITAGLPGLGALVDEDEEATAGMDLTLPAGRVLEHHAQPIRRASVQPSPAPAAVTQSPAPLPARSPTAGAAAPEQHPALATAGQEEQGGAELEPTLAVSLPAAPAASPAVAARLSSGSDELAKGEVARVQMSKWGFAPGADDTLDINLEMHGRMIMGDQTFNRMYCDNTTGDSRYGAPLAPGGADDTGDSLLGQDGNLEGLAADGQHVDTAGVAAVPAASPADSQGAQQRKGKPSPAAAAPPAHRAPNWTAPAFLPPYLQAPAVSGAQSDHPALVQSPNVTSSSLNTLETRRISVGMDARRMSINSRRFSMQDATGRLLADDLDEELLAAAADSQPQAPASGGALPSGGLRTRRRSSGAAFLGRDVTEKLLADDSLQEEGEPGGPLADLKRQMRMLSQGSPVLAPQVEQPAAAQQVTAALLGAAGAAEEAPHVVQQAPAAAKTPRAAVSMGYADSHNPATAGLLRTGGTTRLLQETVQLGGHPTGQEEEEDLLEMEGYDADARGGVAGPSQPDNGGMTARTNGTTKLLADMTMASMVGAKLLGGKPQGTPELAQGPGSDGLTDFSLDEFERPPELPAGQQRQRQQQEALQLGGQQRQQAVDEYASPVVPPGGAGYPSAAELPGSAAIPGGPKLARTPVPIRAASQPPLQGTPHSHPRSVRSQPQHLLHHQAHATPGTHGTHRLARTPGSVHPSGAAYPMEGDVTADGMIPGGPKLARTPVGRTPATGYLAAPGSAVAQHYPGSGRMVQFAAAPGSASVGRYPGSAVALHRGGMTPQLAPPPMTFQDFAKLTEVQFLDNLRRGASINYADLQPNPVPQSLGDAYRLLTIITPQVTTLENGIHILQEEVQARRISAADAEQLVGQVNPAAFQKVQQADEEGLEVLRQHVGLLKKVCRQKAVYCLKDVRRQMEESRGARLRRNAEALRGDLAWAQANLEQLQGVAQAAQQYIADQHRRMAQEEQAQREEAEQRAAVLNMRRAIGEETAANEQRRQRLAEVQERVAKLREEHAVLHREREALRSRTDALQVTLTQSQGQARLERESSPAAILQKLEELEVLKSCMGWQLESAREDPVSGDLALRLADTFRLRLSIGRASASASVEVLPEQECKLPGDRRALLAALAACPGGSGVAAGSEVHVSEPSAAKVAALMQATSARLGRLADLMSELEGLRLAYPALSDITCHPDGQLALSFVNLDAEVKFGVSLRLPGTYPAGPVQQAVRIGFDGEGQITQQRICQAVAAAPEGPGRLRAICRELSLLAREAVPRPALSQDVAFHSNWQNPLFGSQPTVSAQT